MGGFSRSPLVPIRQLQPQPRPRPASPAAALSISSMKSVLYTQPSSPTFLEGGCMGTPRPFSTSQPSLDEAGHSHTACHEPLQRAPDSPLLWEKYLSSPKKAIFDPPPAHPQPGTSKGQLLQSPKRARLPRKLWLSCHLLHPGSNPACGVSCQASL